MRTYTARVQIRKATRTSSGHEWTDYEGALGIGRGEGTNALDASLKATSGLPTGYGGHNRTEDVLDRLRKGSTVHTPLGTYRLLVDCPACGNEHEDYRLVARCESQLEDWQESRELRQCQSHGPGDETCRLYYGHEGPHRGWGTTTDTQLVWRDRVQLCPMCDRTQDEGHEYDCPVALGLCG